MKLAFFRIQIVVIPIEARKPITSAKTCCFSALFLYLNKYHSGIPLLPFGPLYLIVSQAFVLVNGLNLKTSSDVALSMNEQLVVIVYKGSNFRR